MRPNLYWAVLTLLLASGVLAKQPEARGLVVSDATLRSAYADRTLDELFGSIRQDGFNVVYLEIASLSDPVFVSPSLRSLAAEQPPRPDLLGPAINAAQRRRLLVYLRLPDSLGVDGSGPATNWLGELADKRGWLSVTRDGRPGNELNPMHVAVQDVLVNMLVDLGHRYDIDGLQITPAIAVGLDEGYDSTTLAAYAREVSGGPPPDEADPAWVAWRSERSAELALRIIRNLRAVNPDVRLSITFDPEERGLAWDWADFFRWCYCGGNKFNEFMPVVDAESNRVSDEIGRLVQLAGEESINLVTLLRRVDQSGRAGVAAGALLAAVRSHELAGVVVDQRTEMFRNQAPAVSPFKPADWRPAVVVGVRSEHGAWQADVPSFGRYRIITRRDGVWTERLSIELREGRSTFVYEDVDALELLVDQRP